MAFCTPLSAEPGGSDHIASISSSDDTAVGRRSARTANALAVLGRNETRCPSSPTTATRWSTSTRVAMKLSACVRRCYAGRQLMVPMWSIIFVEKSALSISTIVPEPVAPTMPPVPVLGSSVQVPRPPLPDDRLE